MVKGIYVHIPFCSYRCPYCDFYSLVDSPVGPSEYVDLILKEAELYRDTPASPETLYLGGGTPTKLKPGDIRRIVEGIGEIFGVSRFKEVTVECNPEDYGEKEFRSLKACGVNRVSVGVQSFTEKGLRVLGRRHTASDVFRTFLSLRDAGFDNVNLDLIYGYPGQKKEDLIRDLEAVAYLSPDHVSFYLLTPHRGTPLGLRVLSGDVRMPEEEEIWDLHSLLWKALKDLGYVRYEISNWARPGKECRHNLIYWTMKEFLGLGPSAWGFVGRVRYGNVRNITLYRDRVLHRRRPVEKKR
ncbi:MAG: radical SAM family heme chaperone HemW [Aquificota bacterium]|nr:radical SAM family heme chaperone HemW [Aquificota bacterium]